MTPKFVAELSINHLGMINIAKEMMLAAKSSGAHFAKFKIKDVHTYYTDKSKKWRNHNFIDYRKSLELSEEDFYEIDRYSKEIDLPWFSTVHDEKGLKFIQQFDIPFFKVASMDSARYDFVHKVVDCCLAHDKPLIISLGGKSEDFTKELVEFIKQYKVRAYILHTVSQYPTPVGQSNINYLRYLVKTYQDDQVKIGYSGHEEGYSPSVLAALQGAHMIERHFTLSKDISIHHIKAALTPKEFLEMTTIIDNLFLENSQAVTDLNREELDFIEKREYV